MESNGEPLKIHISKPCNAELQRLGGYITEERGEVEMKGERGGEMASHHHPFMCYEHFRVAFTYILRKNIAQDIFSLLIG